jgi:hypothetical protein
LLVFGLVARLFWTRLLTSLQAAFFFARFVRRFRICRRIGLATACLPLPEQVLLFLVVAVVEEPQRSFRDLHHEAGLQATPFCSEALLVCVQVENDVVCCFQLSAKADVLHVQVDAAAVPPCIGVIDLVVRQHPCIVTLDLLDVAAAQAAQLTLTARLQSRTRLGLLRGGVEHDVI